MWRAAALLTAIANSIDRTVTGFDSFAGLPADWRQGVKKGAFACPPPKLPQNAELKIGMIENTLPVFLAEMAPAPIRFIHIDTDLYEPAKLILDTCAPLMQDTVIVFDEFFNFPGWQDHEYRAFADFQKKNPGIKCQYIGVGGNSAVSVRATKEPASPV